MPTLKALGLTLLAVFLLWAQMAFLWRDGIQNLPGSSWRFWDDMTLAIARYVDATSNQAPLEDQHSELTNLAGPYRGMVEDKIANVGIEPHQFWRTVNDRKFRLPHAPFSPPKNEDRGRSLLLLLCFKAFGGVAPYLLLWLGALAFVPVLYWVAHEFVSSGLATAGATLLGLVSLSPFWIECLTLPHSAIAFYLGGLVALSAFSLAVFLPGAAGPTKWRSLAYRAVLLTAILIVAIWCRSGSIFFVPPAFAVAAIGFARGGLPPVRSMALAAALVLVPVLALRPRETHNVWLPLWEGLGDFGADHGYSWYDADAGRFLAGHGIPGRTEFRYVTETEEAIFKEAFLSGVSSSPLWYIGILAKRVVATLGLTHLAPYGPRDGESRKTPLFHYKYSTPVDWFGWKDFQREVRVSWLYGPTLLLLAWGLFARSRALGEVSVLATIGLATLPVPLLISTASGLETQAFSLVYFLGAAFLVQRSADALLNRFQRA